MFEKRGDPRENPYPRTRSNIIGLRSYATDVMRDVGITLPDEGFKSGVHLLHGGIFAQAAAESDMCRDQLQEVWCLDRRMSRPFRRILEAGSIWAKGKASLS